jgi:hypothetical protein
MDRDPSTSRTVRLSILEAPRVAFALILVLLALATAAKSAITLPAGWSHAQVNVVIKHVAHTLIYDRGTVTRIAPGALTLKESDGTVNLIRIAPSAVVTLGGRPIPFSALRRGEFAQTVRVDGAPAESVRAHRVGGAG